MIIAIDGPAGSGKSTTAKMIGKKLNYLYIDTGAMYRAMALKTKLSNVKFTDSKAVISLLHNTDIVQIIDKVSGDTRTILDGNDVSTDIRTPEITKGVGPVCEVKEVRTQLVDLQRKMGKEGNVILDGRDIGTVVFPDADVKIYLIADPKVRAERRLAELKSKGHDTTLEEVLKDMIDRDKRDSSRKEAPMKPADDAIFVDTSNLTIEGQVDKIIEIVNGTR